MPHKLLLADDSVTIQRVIELTFADEDVQVHAVGDGQKAIASIQADRPDIVLADVGMPERDGYEVATFVKGNPELAHIPVLLLTGAFEPIDEVRARAAGCDGVLVKPFEPQMVINRVKDLLAGHRSAALWGAGPGAATPPKPPAREEPRAGGPQGAPSEAGASLEDYFDRLDAAFASFDGGAAPPAAAPPAAPVPSPAFEPPPAHQAESAGDALGGWDPDLTGDPRRTHSIEMPPAPVVPAPAAPPPPFALPPQAPAAAPIGSAQPLPTLAEAFAALLSAEQAHPVAPAAVAEAPVSDDMVEEIVQRVIARMSDHAVRDTVVDVAERLVRQEIERIKNG